MEPELACRGSQRGTNMTDAQPLWDHRRFWTGFLGGVAPYLIGFATLFYTIAEYSELPPLSTALLRVIAVVVFSFLGGITAMIWGAKEKDLQRLFVIGMGAPAIIASVLTNAQSGLKPHANTSKAGISALSQPPQIPINVSPRFEAVGVLIKRERDPFPVLRATELSGEPLPPRQVSVGLVLGEVLRAIGVSNADSKTAIPLSVLALAMLTTVVYSAWGTIQRRRAVALLSTRFALSELGPPSDVEIIAKPSPEPRESIALLSKGDSFEKGLAALNEDRFQQAIEFFTQAISDIGDAFNYRAKASYHLGRYDNALRDFDTFLELRPDDAVGMFNKGVTLGALNRSEEELAVYDDVVRRFGTAAAPALQERVAKALVNKGLTLGALNRSEEALAVYDDVVRRFGTAVSSELREIADAASERIQTITAGPS